jgi:N4-gp56 family major capsid protein
MAVQSIGTAGSPGTAYSTDPGRYYDRKFLERLQPQLHFMNMGDKRPLPKNSGTLIVWHRLQKQAAATTPLTEGANPSEGSIATDRVTAEPLEYGAFVKLSGKLNLEAVNPIVEEVTDELADQAALSYDSIVLAGIHANLTNQFANGAANEAAVADADVLNSTELRKAVFRLRNGGVSTSSKVGVPGFEGNMYKGVITPAQWFDLASATDAGSFIEVHKYNNPAPLMNGELGQLWGVRLAITNNYTVGTGATDETYRAFIFGKGAYGVTELSGQGIKTIRQPAGGNSDPLEMYTTVGWKFTMATAVLQAARGIEIYTGSAAT